MYPPLRRHGWVSPPVAHERPAGLPAADKGRASEQWRPRSLRTIRRVPACKATESVGEYVQRADGWRVAECRTTARSKSNMPVSCVASSRQVTLLQPAVKNALMGRLWVNVTTLLKVDVGKQLPLKDAAVVGKRRMRSRCPAACGAGQTAEVEHGFVEGARREGGDTHTSMVPSGPPSPSVEAATGPPPTSVFELGIVEGAPPRRTDRSTSLTYLAHAAVAQQRCLPVGRDGRWRHAGTFPAGVAPTRKLRETSRSAAALGAPT